MAALWLHSGCATEFRNLGGSMEHWNMEVLGMEVLGMEALGLGFWTAALHEI